MEQKNVLCSNDIHLSFFHETHGKVLNTKKKQI